MGENIEVSNNTEDSQYEANVDGHTALAAYRLDGQTITFTHTEVPPPLEGRGIASRLVTAALKDVRERNLRVVPQCAYVAAYIERHPEYKDLIDASD